MRYRLAPYVVHSCRGNSVCMAFFMPKDRTFPGAHFSNRRVQGDVIECIPLMYAGLGNVHHCDYEGKEK